MEDLLTATKGGLYCLSAGDSYEYAFWFLQLLILGNSPNRDSAAGRTKESRSWTPKWSNVEALVFHIVLFFQRVFATITSSLPTWLVARPLRGPYDWIYATLPRIQTYSTSSKPSSLRSTSLQIAFQAWRPSPAWKRRVPGPPDFHVCVLDSRDPFPTLRQLEELYVSVAREHPVGKGLGKVVLAVVDCGVSNYLSLDDILGQNVVEKNVE